jgi:hypothetical protein
MSLKFKSDEEGVLLCCKPFPGAQNDRNLLLAYFQDHRPWVKLTLSVA